MLLSRREVFSPTEEQKIILGHMGYAAFKLWNVANYEKRNYKELGMSQYPNWYDQKKRLKENFFYKNLPSQTAQDVLQQLEEAWKSFFMLLKSKGVENPNPPRFHYFFKRCNPSGRRENTADHSKTIKNLSEKSGSGC